MHYINIRPFTQQKKKKKSFYKESWNRNDKLEKICAICFSETSATPIYSHFPTENLLEK